ncbi:MAG: class II aldolase/adducin family protein, partial [Ilumatobacteraceae bacterium]
MREALGDGFAYVDWMRPGFSLSKVVAELPDRDGVVLAHHGLITWGESSQECLERTRATVDRASTYLEALPLRAPSAVAVADMPDEEIERLLLRLRGAMSRTGRRVLRIDRRLRAIADRSDVAEVVAGGVSSADHMLRIKPRSAIAASADSAVASVDAYASDYAAYVERHIDAMPEGFGMHDPMPRVSLVPGLGAVTTGANLRDAEVAADIALHTHGVAATVSDRIGTPG